MKRGIDVSSHQGVIDWDVVKGNIDYAIIRCGYGANRESQDDIYFKRNADECTRLGIPFGVYLYSYADNIDWSNSEVEHVLRLVKGYKLEYPIYYDIEDKVQANLSNDALTDIIVNFCDKLEQNGYYVGVYANLNWWNTKLNSERLNAYAKWVARYNSTLGYDAGMWQYTSSGTISGINGNVDMDYCYVDYPEAIKKAGLNGFTKEDSSSETPTEPSPEIPPVTDTNTEIENLKKQIEELKQENKQLQETCQEKALIFTCEKTGTYYIELKEQDKLFYESGKSLS